MVTYDKDVATVVDDSNAKKPKLDMTNVDMQSFTLWLILNSIKSEEITKAFPIVDDKRIVELQFLVNGVPVDVLPAIRLMREQYDEMVEGAAKMMFDEKLGERFSKVESLIQDFKEELSYEGRQLFPLSSRFEDD